MAKFGTNIMSKTGGIKPRERAEFSSEPMKMKTAPGRFLDAHHKAENLEKENQVLRKKTIAISELTIVEGRKRALPKDRFEELKANLATFPLINPIVIRALPAGKFEIIAGHNRLQAYVELGRDEIEANVIELDDEQVLPAAFYSNLLAPELPDYEKYLGYKQIQRATGKTQIEMARESGLSAATLSNYFSFDELEEGAHKILAAQPELAGARLASKLKGLPFVKEALEQLAEGRITQEQAANVAANFEKVKSKPVVQASLVIKNGKQHFAEISSRGNLTIVKMKDISAIPELAKKIEALIREEMENQQS
ncbi:MAG: ParB/RepB/Spo0J family partition protein [Janthinobacterium lividum]